MQPVGSLAFVGFDSAWTDNPKAPGALAAVRLAPGEAPVFCPPQLVNFSQALTAIRKIEATATFTVVALDQPTIVTNANGMRPVERVAASLISWMGGGVQPSNRGRKGMFCDASPIWPFLQMLGASEDPVAARHAAAGLHLVEVFPALALASLDAAFFARAGSPKYNPARRRTFRQNDWVRVASVAAAHFGAFDLLGPANWCKDIGALPTPRKSDQDKLDSMICLLVALLWRLRPAMTMMLGSLADGYMVTPISPAVRARVAERAAKLGVPCEEPAG